MYEIIKSNLAKNDLKEIYRYSFHKWGNDKAVEYLLQIDSALEELISNPQLGRTQDNIRQGYRSLQSDKHVAYYRVDGENIYIVRVLHERMLPEKHL